MAHLNPRVYHTINMRLLIGPCDRNLVYAAFCSGVALLAILKSIVPAIGIFAAGLALSFILGTRDPQWLYWVFFARLQKTYYDPCK